MLTPEQYIQVLDYISDVNKAPAYCFEFGKGTEIMKYLQTKSPEVFSRVPDEVDPSKDDNHIPVFTDWLFDQWE